jgi:MarR family transcriptional regulator, 2-MHQ and catechol-resistance regulon repressor
MPARRASTAPSARKGPVREWPQIKAMRLLFRASARLDEAHRRYLGEKHDLLVSEFDMIAALGNTEGLNMGQLASAMITTPANVTRVAQALEKRGLVERRRAPHSDREVLARLTPAGDAFFRDHFIEVVGFASDLMDRGLSSNEQKQLGELLGKLHAALTAE